MFTFLCVSECVFTCLCVFAFLCVCLPDRPPTKELAQVMGNLRFRVKGLKKQRAEPGTTSRLEEERPLGRPSGRSPFPGQTAPDPSQIPEEPGEFAALHLSFEFYMSP